MDEILSSANEIAADYYQERQLLVSDQAARAARLLFGGRSRSRRHHSAPRSDPPEVSPSGCRWYRSTASCPTRLLPLWFRSWMSPQLNALRNIRARRPIVWPPRCWPVPMRRGPSRHSARRATCCTRRRVVRGADGQTSGVVVATDFLEASVATRSRRMTQEFENYNQLRVFSRPLTGVYLLFFLMVTLMILVGATWMGLYLAKRITRPVQMLAHAAREIGAGHLDQRVEPQSDDEFGALTEAFNNMASELATSRLKVEQTTLANSSNGAATSKRFSSASRPV